jgi:hypothetical protein
MAASFALTSAAMLSGKQSPSKSARATGSNATLPAMHAPSSLVWFAAACVSLWLAGCGCEGVMCGVCSGVPITIVVTDAQSEMPIEDATVLIDGNPCKITGFQGPGAYACDGAVGSHSIEISAPGHVSKSLTVALPDEDDDSCCSCGPQTSATAELDPAMP